METVESVSSSEKHAAVSTTNTTVTEPKKKCSFQYIPINGVITRMISQNGVWPSMIRKAQSDSCKDSKLLTSYAGGSLCKKHAMFGHDKYAIILHLYIGEIEVCNPIGAHRSSLKLCAFYFFIGNLENHYHSQLNYIHLCLLVKEKYIKTLESYEQLLKPLIEDLKVLCNDGILINVDGQTVRFFGGIATVSAGNLSAYALAGLKKVFNSGRICRFCMVSYDELGVKLSEFDTMARSEEMHLYHLQTLNWGIPAATYDVEKYCPLMNLPYFKVTETFPLDIMHDLMEGVIPLTLKIIRSLSHAVTLMQINVELASFKFGQNNFKNKPVFLPASLASANISGSASEKVCFFRLFSFSVGDRIPREDQYWSLYLQ